MVLHFLRSSDLFEIVFFMNLGNSHLSAHRFIDQSLHALPSSPTAAVIAGVLAGVGGPVIGNLETDFAWNILAQYDWIIFDTLIVSAFSVAVHTFHFISMCRCSNDRISCSMLGWVCF